MWRGLCLGKNQSQDPDWIDAATMGDMVNGTRIIRLKLTQFRHEPSDTKLPDSALQKVRTGGFPGSGSCKRVAVCPGAFTRVKVVTILSLWSVVSARHNDSMMPWRPFSINVSI